MKKDKETVIQQNDMMIKDQFFRLADYHGLNCISIYMPTFRAGEEVDSHKGELRLKNLRKDLKKQLEDKNLGPREIDHILKPLQELLDDVHFWRNQSDGLAIFLHNGNMETYTLPLHFDEFVYVSDHYYMKPLVSLFSDNGKFYLLAISLKSVRLFEGTRHSISELEVDDLVPGQLEDVVGYDFEDKSLQFRTGHAGNPENREAGATFHGHGSGKDDEKQEIYKFLRAVNEGVTEILNHEQAPLVLACLEEHYGLYKKANSYKNLFPGFINRNPDNEDPVFLHELAWDLIGDEYQKEREKRISQFRDLSASGKTLDNLKEIVPAAVDGRIESLFIEPGKEEYGIFNPGNHEVLLGRDHANPAALFNMCAIHTLKNGGQVFKCDPEDMPVKGTQINALLRF
jgi:hypothetical protein